MKKLNLIVSLLIAAVFIFGQIGIAQAAPVAQEPTPAPDIEGTIQDIDIMNMTTADPYVLVEILLADGTTIEKVKLSLGTAETMGLIIKEGDVYVVDETKLDPDAPAEITIPQTDILPDTGTEDGFQHPIGVVLEIFFGEDVGLDYDAIMAYHDDDGIGFGVLAQAMWMAKNLKDLESDVTLDQIVEAKQSGDFSEIVLPDGSTPKNWGQLRKAALDKGNNLGSVKSGQSDADNTDNKDKGQPDDKNNGKDKNKDKGNHKP